MEVYRISDLIKAHNPTNLQLDVLRVKLVASMYRIELLKTNINIYVAREKEFLPKWYDNKMLYFTSGIVSTLLTTNLIIKVFKQ